MTPGSQKADGGFWIACDSSRTAIVILTKIAVDAPSPNEA